MIDFIHSEEKAVKVGDTVFEVKTKEDEKKLKGYQYDSLIYRYIQAREQMAEYEYLRDKQSNVSNHTEWTVYRQRANRDIMRFVQILDEVIGEHE
jgi:hypothetical protein